MIPQSTAVALVHAIGQDPHIFDLEACVVARQRIQADDTPVADAHVENVLDQEVRVFE